MINALLKKNLIPKACYKLSIQCALWQRLYDEKRRYKKTNGACKEQLIESLAMSPTALSTAQSKQQHYEVPTEFYQLILGSALKYSCNYYLTPHDTLSQAELNMINLFIERADIKNGQRILDLGCGWGSVTLTLARLFPDSQITAVSHSKTQQQYIQSKVDEEQLDNVKTYLCDVNDLTLTEQYDRVISIEMFEHIRNYEKLLDKISQSMNPGGIVFIHHFCHKNLAYTFNKDESWMAKYFFTDGVMPSEDLLHRIKTDLVFDKQWQVNGLHYSKTCYHWLENHYNRKNEILNIFKEYYEEPYLYYQYWDLFIRSCAQLFAWNNGNEWFITHYRFKKSDNH